MPRSDMLPAALLVQKAKLFDDGLYAAVELAAQDGAGRFAGKRSMLTAFVAAVLKTATTPAQPPIVLLAGAKLGGVADKIPPAIEPAVSEVIAGFRRNPVRSLPISFYTWSAELTKIFQEDRMLQTRLGMPRRACWPPGWWRCSSRATYEAYNAADHRRLTNPLADEQDVLKPGRICFFPPSRSFEGDLLWRISSWASRSEQFRPDGRNDLAGPLRKLSLTPTASSGWYDYTAWSLEPMIVPDKSAEGSAAGSFRDVSRASQEPVQRALALARETHIKQLATPPAPSAPASEPVTERQPSLSVRIWPPNRCRPLYLRRAQGYRFVAQALEEHLRPRSARAIAPADNGRAGQERAWPTNSRRWRTCFSARRWS